MSADYRILVVDDDQEQTALIEEFLHLSGIPNVVTTYTLNGMWQSLQSARYDLILLDYRLPDGNGLEALAEIKSRKLDIPVVMITAQGDINIAVQALQQGAADYLLKGSDYLRTLPAQIKKTIHAHELELSVQRSLETIRYQALLLNNVRDALVVWNPDGEITYWNPAAQRLYGWSAEERLGKLVSEVYLNTFDPPPLPPGLEDTGVQHIERLTHKQNGKPIWVSSRMSVLRDRSGKILLGHMDISFDITKNKQMESQIQAAQIHLAEAARLATLGELASGVAHQINNPLTTIIADAQLLLRALPKGQPERESAEAIEQAGWRLLQVVQRLLDFSRPSTDEYTSTDINQTIENALVLVGAQITALGISLEKQLEHALPRVFANPRQVEDLWVNLLLLARDATSDGKPHKVVIRSIYSAPGWVRVEVQDDGEQIPASQLQGIFEPNFIDSSIGRGSGLELSICREIVRQHAGKIGVESKPDLGTVFWVALSLKDSASPLALAGHQEG